MYKFLIVKTSSLGDIIQALPVARYLKEKFPGATVDWVVEEKHQQALSISSDVDSLLMVDTQKLRKNFSFSLFTQMRRALSQNTYNAVFDLQGNIKSALITFFTRSKHKVGFSFNSAPEAPASLVLNHRVDVSKIINRRKAYLFVVQSYFKDENFSLTPSSSVKEERVKPLFMIAPGSRWKNKQLGKGAWLVLLFLLQKTYDPKFIFIYGSPEEKNLADLWSQQFKESQSLGNLPVKEWRDLMEKMDVIIAVDSAALHLAGSTQTPTFSLFGPTSAECYVPLGSQHGFVQGSCPYNENFTQRCRLLRKCSTGACMKELKGEFVFEKFKRWYEK